MRRGRLFAIGRFFVFYDTGIRVSELCGLRLGNFDHKQGILTVKGKGSKERRVALGSNCQRNLIYYIDKHRPDDEELAEWGSAGEDHLFLSETRQPLTKNGITLLFMRLKKRAGITGKRISPHIFRHTFAVRYLILGNDPFSLQELLGHEDFSHEQSQEAHQTNSPDQAALPWSAVGRAIWEPGWRWSEHMRPLVGTESCQGTHFTYIISGHLRTRMDSGTEFDLGPGDIAITAPGHDAWDLGDEPCIGLDIQGASRNV